MNRISFFLGINLGFLDKQPIRFLLSALDEDFKWLFSVYFLKKHTKSLPCCFISQVFSAALGLCSPFLPATALAPHPCRCCGSKQQTKLCVSSQRGKLLLLLGGAGEQERQMPLRWERSRNPLESFGPGLTARGRWLLCSQGPLSPCCGNLPTSLLLFLP